MLLSKDVGGDSDRFDNLFLFTNNKNIGKEGVMNIWPFKVSLLIMGASGIIAQIVLVRELLISFLGNELTLGIILANWLILEAVGSFIAGKYAEKWKRKMEVYIFLQLIFAAALPLAIYLCRVFKNILAAPGEGLGFGPVFYSSFLILLPSSLFHGALFTIGCKLYSQYTKEAAASIGKVYVLETMGSIAGGLLITFLLIQYFNSLEIALIVSLFNALISIILLLSEKARHFYLRKGVWLFSVFSALFFFIFLFSPLAEIIHRASVRSQYRGLDVIHHENSIYGNITVTKREEQYTFFTNGLPSLTTPVPDTAILEDIVHFSMLLHEKPGSVLILSGGAGGMISEILKHPVSRVDYVELDPLLLKLIQRFSTPLTLAELSSERLKVHFTDGRYFVTRTADRFDLIFIGLSAPQELQTNRLFSAEFFSLAGRKMNPGGIIVLTLPGSLTYISPELRDLNGCIWDTLKSVYEHVRVIPGDVNIYFASNCAKLVGVDVGEMLKRLEERKVKTNLFTKSYLEYRLQETRLSWFLKAMERKEAHINSDTRPIGVFFTMSYWNALFSPYLAKIFKLLEKLNLAPAIGISALVTLLLLLLFIKRPHFSTYSVPYAIFTSGFADMVLDLAIIFTFQSLYGFLFHQIGLLVTVFMFGLALSGYFITQRLVKIRKPVFFLLGAETAMILFALALPFVLTFPSQYLAKKAVYVIFYGTILVMSFFCGALVGFQFPLASKIYLSAPAGERMVGRTAGLLYGADLAGGFLGALCGGIFLLPVLGLKNACFMIAAIKVGSFFLLFTKIGK